MYSVDRMLHANVSEHIPMLYVARGKKPEEHVTPVRRHDVTRSGTLDWTLPV